MGESGHRSSPLKHLRLLEFPIRIKMRGQMLLSPINPAFLPTFSHVKLSQINLGVLLGFSKNFVARFELKRCFLDKVRPNS